MSEILKLVLKQDMSGGGVNQIYLVKMTTSGSTDEAFLIKCNYRFLYNDFTPCSHCLFLCVPKTTFLLCKHLQIQYFAPKVKRLLVALD
jgi:hypothetical protein